ncbi:MAG: hypothetical protein ABRQ37_09970 [Candidatus Eremiobacterota bacterium]
MNRFTFITVILIFFFLFPCVVQAGEPVSVKGTIVKIDGSGMILKKADAREISFHLSDKTIFVKENLICTVDDFILGDTVYCFCDPSVSSKELLALVDSKSGDSMSGETNSNWLLLLQKAFYGEKESLRGTVKKIVKGESIVRILTENNREEELYIMKDLLFFDKNRIVDFSWERLKKGTVLQVIGYRKDKRFNVFYIESNSGVKSNRFTSKFGTFTGEISWVDLKNQIIEIKNSDAKKMKFKITGDTVLFNWDICEKIDFKDLLKGQKVKIESIVSLNNIGEAIILEVGDEELYY